MATRQTSSCRSRCDSTKTLSIPQEPGRNRIPIASRAKLQAMFYLTSRTCMVHLESGITARSFGTRELTPLFFHRQLPQHRTDTQRISSGIDYSLTRWNFCNSFILTFMQDAGFVGSVLKLPTFKPLNLSMFSIYPLCFDTLEHSFAPRKMLTPLFSSTTALFDKNTRGRGTLGGTLSQSLARGFV